MSLGLERYVCNGSESHALKRCEQGKSNSVYQPSFRAMLDFELQRHGCCYVCFYIILVKKMNLDWKPYTRNALVPRRGP